MNDGRKGPRRLSEDEHALWSAVTRAVKPLRRVKQKPDGGEPPLAVKAPLSKAAPPAASKPIAKPLPVKAAPAAPLGRRLKQKIARGHEPIEARIDLHGLTQSEAHHALVRFLRNAQNQGARLVLVITGKGVRDDFAERGVLRRQVPHWLESAECRPFVLGFEQAHVSHGGEGALYVRIRRVR